MYVFDTLGYRRFEWKCHDLNEPSKRAAQRFGFTFTAAAFNLIRLPKLLAAQVAA